MALEQIANQQKSFTDRLKERKDVANQYKQAYLKQLREAGQSDYKIGTTSMFGSLGPMQEALTGIVESAGEDTSGTGLSLKDELDARLKALEQGYDLQIGEDGIELVPTESSEQSKAKRTKQEMTTLIDDLLESPSKTAGFTGFWDIRQKIPGTGTQRMFNKWKRLEGMLALENIDKLRGTGAISDKEFETLKEAASELGENLSDKDFRAELRNLKGVLGGKEDKEVGELDETDEALINKYKNQ